MLLLIGHVEHGLHFTIEPLLTDVGDHADQSLRASVVRQDPPPGLEPADLRVVSADGPVHRVVLT